MVVLYLINNYLFFKDSGKLVENVDIASGSFDEYPWGRALFKMTLDFIHNQMKEKDFEG